MKFRLLTVLWVFALLATAMATFGLWGILVTLYVASFWVVAFRKMRMNLFGWFVSAAIFFVLVALLRPAIGSARSAARRSGCLSNIKMIGFAIQNYADKHGMLPPAYTVDGNGKPLHSWRVLILPFLEEQNLYDAIDLNEPWDGPNNRKLWDRMPDAYRCVSCEHACELGAFPKSLSAPNYFAVVGKQTCWPGSSTIKWSDITDGTSETILFFETKLPNTCWMEPVDLTVEEAMEVLCTNLRPGHLVVDEKFFSASITSELCHVGFADAHGRSLSSATDEKHVAGLLTRSGNETLDMESNPGRAEVEPFSMKLYNWKRIYSFTLFVLLSLLPLAKFRRRHVLAELLG